MKLSLPSWSRPKPTPMTFEHSMLRTATLCLIAFGAVMVYSASSGTSLLNGGGDSSMYLKRYLMSAAVGLIALGYFSRNGVAAAKRYTPVLLVVSIAGLLLVLVPGFGVQANGARRWLGAGPLQIQPSEIAKLALVLYSAGLIAAKPKRIRSLKGVRPLLLVAATMALLIIVEPDLGTAIVISLTLGALLVVSGVKLRHLGTLFGSLILCVLLLALLEPYRRARLTAFLDPWADAHGSGFQSVQAMIAIGSGGPFGVGLGQSVQKLFYLPEAHTDMILAVIGEELGFVGIAGVLFLYGMIAYAGLRTARRAAGRYAKLLATGLTSLILCQGLLNIFVVLGLAPLTGVPLPFISYAPTNLCIMLASVGLLLNIAQPGARRLRAVGDSAEDRDRSRRDGRPRRSGAGSRGRTAR